jgi:DNA-binding transcriptional ArsR family regulator
MGDRCSTDIVGAIAVYLRENPDACDTAEGIHRWWFSPEAGYTQDAVARALDWMTEHGLVEATTAADGRQRFRRLAARDDLAELLRKLAGGQDLP